tara:strand:+ start:807 stop:2078 length:1272 start_codon:yes stop_codon:yes gene_type:complete
MPTKKVIDMTARSSSALAYDDYLYLTGESPNIDEKMQASVLRDYTLQGVKTSANSGLAQTSTPYATSNPDRELSLDVGNLAAAGGGTASVTDYIAIEQGAGTKKLLVGDLPFASSASSVSSVLGGTNIGVTGVGNVTVNLDATLTGLTSVTSTDFVGALTGNADTATALATARNIAGESFDGTAAIDIPITGLSDVYASMAPADGDVLTYDTTNGWQSETPTTGDITGVTAGTGLSGGGTSGTVSLSLSSPVTVATGGTGQTSYTNGQLLIGNTTGNTLTKSTLTAGSNVTITNGTGTIEIAATDTNTTYSAGDGLDLTGTTFSTDLKTNGGLVIESAELALDIGASSITGTLAVDDGGTGQTSYTNGQLLIGNTTGNTLTKATLTAGSNITITEGAGSITIAAASGGDPAGTAVAMAIALGG